MSTLCKKNLNDREWSLNLHCHNNESSGEDVWGAVTGSCSQDDPRATQETALSTPPRDCK